MSDIVSFCFGIAAAIIVHLAGTNIVDNPVKFLVLSFAIVIAHEISRSI